jgi:creatinine amidohydrolase
MKKLIHFLAISLTLIFIFKVEISAQVKATPSTRQMNFITWQEFQRVVPKKTETVLLPVGSIEPHGVIPNGTDNLAPEAMAGKIAQRLNAMIAPTLNYGVTPGMKAFPGAITISEKAYNPFVKDILKGLADNGFKNIIVLNGHGGNTRLLQQAALEVSNLCRVRILVVNWWALTPDITKEVFGEDGGHAANNETAYIQAIYPQYIHPDQYDKDMATPNAAGSSWYAAPVPSSISLYKKGEGYPTFDKKQAKEYFHKVNNRVAELIEEIIFKWDKAGLYR